MPAAYTYRIEQVGTGRKPAVEESEVEKEKEEAERFSRYR